MSEVKMPVAEEEAQRLRAEASDLQFASIQRKPGAWHELERLLPDRILDIQRRTLLAAAQAYSAEYPDVIGSHLASWLELLAASLGEPGK